MTVRTDEERLLTAEEVAEILRVRPKWVYDAAVRGEFPSYKIGARYVRFRRADIDAYLERRAS